MGRNPKCYIHNTPVYITTSVQEGLPLVATTYMNLIVEGILAAAQTKYPVTFCGYCVMANHIHILLVVQNPNDVYKFLGYLKCELAHAINRLLGRNQRSVWVEGYDSPTILTPMTVWEKLRYIHLNPVKANLVERCGEFPGVSSYEALLAGGMTKKCRRVARDSITALPKRKLSQDEQEQLTEILREAPGANYELEVEPWAFLKCFEEEKNLDHFSYLERFLKELTDEEKHYARIRTKPVIGAHALSLEDPRTPYSSNRSGKKMICLSEDINLRKRFIGWFKDQCEIARQVYLDFRDRNIPLSPPPGFFRPGGTLCANLLAPFFIGILF
jgi:REP element-mobilizing transposase RayT